MQQESGAVNVCILMAVHQGAAFLRDQLESFTAQTLINWSLIISDDSPQPDDGSGAILQAFLAAQLKEQGRDITVRSGPRSGFAANFLTLLRDVPDDALYAAISDQDDVWLPDKLARAVAMIGADTDAIPTLYCARTNVVDADLTHVGISPAFRHAPAFENALVQSIGGGNTMVLNRAAIDLVRQAATDDLQGSGTVVAHDWWLYQIISGCGGVVLRDDTPVLLYRQHGGNMIGANRSFGARVGRGFAVLGGRLKSWNRINMAALTVSEHRFTPTARAALARYRAAQHGPIWRRLTALRASGVWRQSKADTVALYLASALGRL